MPWSVDDNSPSQIRALLARHGLALKKRWGQNFMTSPAARSAIVAGLELAASDRVWEIGPGLGAITAMLLEVAQEVTVFEIDWGLIDLITQRFGTAIRIAPGDAVETIRENAHLAPDLIVGNLPYRSAAAIITTILENELLVERTRRLVFTVQREMARRLVASPSTKEYSALSVLCQTSCNAVIDRDLGKGSFYPAPDVVSSIILLEPAAGDRGVRQLASRLSRSLFSNRRKTVANNVAFAAQSLTIPAMLIHHALAAAGISEQDRAEVIHPDQYIQLATALAKLSPGLLEGST